MRSSSLSFPFHSSRRGSFQWKLFSYYNDALLLLLNLEYRSDRLILSMQYIRCDVNLIDKKFSNDFKMGGKNEDILKPSGNSLKMTFVRIECINYMIFRSFIYLCNYRWNGKII